MQGSYSIGLADFPQPQDPFSCCRTSVRGEGGWTSTSRLDPGPLCFLGSSLARLDRWVQEGINAPLQERVALKPLLKKASLGLDDLNNYPCSLGKRLEEGVFTQLLVT